MLESKLTVADGMRRHLITLERERRNLEQSALLCQELQSMDIPVAALDADAVLDRMETMEKDGMCFQNKHTQDVRVHYIAPGIVTVGMVALMTFLSALMIWAYRVAPEDAPPVGLLWLLIGLFAAVGTGVVLAFTQRVGEIRKGEMEDAKNY